MDDQHARSRRVLDPAYVEGLESRGLDELRAMHAESLELETEASYVRRLTQARIDILEAEVVRREQGGSLEDLINDLPKILADPGPRGDPATSRLPMQLAPTRDSEWDPRVAEFEGTLANLPGLTADELTTAIDGLRALEREVSDQRRALFAVIDRIDLVLADRLQAG